MRRASTAGRFGARTVLWTILGLGGGLLMAAVLPVAFGLRSFTVMSGSMEPAVRTGDVVVAEPIRPLEARIGDLVTFRDPSGSGRMISHRVRAVHATGRSVAFTTKGDANNTTEHWTVSQQGQIGRVTYRLRALGYVLVWTRTPAGRLLLIALPLLALGAWCLVRIWRRDQSGGTADATS